MTEWLHFHFSLSCIGEGNGNPLQWSCLENLRVRGDWWAAVYGVAQNWTQLKQFNSSSRAETCCLKIWEYQSVLPVSWETCMLVKKQQLEPWMEQLIGSGLRKEYYSPICCHPVYLMYTWSRVGWVTSWNQDRWEKHQQPHVCGWYHSNGRKQRGTKEPLDEGEGGEWRSQLKTKY